MLTCSWPAASRQGCSLLGPEVDDALAGPEATELLQEVSVVTGLKTSLGGYRSVPVYLSLYGAVRFISSLFACSSCTDLTAAH